MPYYAAGDYYRGDYYRGDFLGLGKAFKAVTGVVSKLNLPIVSGVAGAVNRFAGGSSNLPVLSLPRFGPGTGMSVPEPGVTGTVHRLAPGGHPGYGRYTKGPHSHWTERKRPRMQVTNVRALKRAGRRVRGFLKIASRLGALPISRGGGKKLFKRKRHSK